MDDAPIHFWFDYVDPVSFVVELRLRRAERRTRATAERRGWEIAPPPSPVVDPSDPAWLGRWRAAAAEAEADGVELARPRFVPWTRKAHELALHADANGAFDPVHVALFEAHHLEGRDLGRIDVLVELARECGLDAAQVRTVLGVDRYLPGLLERRQEAERRGLRGVPTLALGGGRIEGLTDEETIAALLADGTSAGERTD